MIALISLSQFVGCLALGFIVLIAAAYIFIRPHDRAKADPGRDAIFEPPLSVPSAPSPLPRSASGYCSNLVKTDSLCPDCTPSRQCNACFIKQCQAKSADRLATGRWSSAPSALSCSK